MDDLAGLDRRERLQDLRCQRNNALRCGRTHGKNHETYACPGNILLKLDLPIRGDHGTEPGLDRLPHQITVAPTIPTHLPDGSDIVAGKRTPELPRDHLIEEDERRPP